MTAAVAAHIGARNRIVGAKALHASGDIRSTGLIATCVTWRGRIAGSSALPREARSLEQARSPARAKSHRGSNHNHSRNRGRNSRNTAPRPTIARSRPRAAAQPAMKTARRSAPRRSDSANAAALAARKTVARSLRGEVMTILSPGNVIVHPPFNLDGLVVVWQRGQRQTCHRQAFTGNSCANTRSRYRRVDEMCSLKCANHQRACWVLAAPAYLNAGEADDKICTVRPATGKAW